MEEGIQIDRRERNDGQWNLFITFSGLEISSMIFVYCIFILCRFLYNPFDIKHCSRYIENMLKKSKVILLFYKN